MNMLGDDTADGADSRARVAHGCNYDRLAAIKAAYDPTNFFHRNHNIVPSQQPGAVTFAGS